MHIILGLDPGSRIAGFGVIGCRGDDLKYIAHGSLELSSKLPFEARLLMLGEKLAELYLQYKPHATAIEKIFLGKNADSAFRLGHARGVCLYHAALAGSEVFEYATRSVKKGITGNGGAEKETVELILRAQFNLQAAETYDASDALALAVYHGRNRAVSENLKRAQVRAKEML